MTPMEGRGKCERPRGGKARWCAALAEVLNAKDTVGVFQYDGFNLRTGSYRTIGVAARATRKGRPILFNACPYCGESILFADKPATKDVPK